MAKTPKTELDQLPSIHDAIRSYIERHGVHYGYHLDDFDRIVASFRGQNTLEDFLQELYDAMPKAA